MALDPMNRLKLGCQGSLTQQSEALVWMSPISIITSLVLAALAISGSLSCTEYCIGMFAIAGIQACIALFSKTETQQKLSILFGVAINCLLIALTMANIIPLKTIGYIYLIMSATSICCCPCVFSIPCIAKKANDDFARNNGLTWGLPQGAKMSLAQFNQLKEQEQQQLQQLMQQMQNH